MAGAHLATDFWLNESISPYDVWQHGVTKILGYRRTKFQEMYVVESGSYGKALVLDGKWQTTTVDEFLYHEPLAHIPCILHGSPTRVLIAGGADGGILREILKWDTVEIAVVAEIDGEVIHACREHLPEIHQGAFDDPRARIVVADAWELLESTPGEWDVIIADLTDPLEDGPAFKLFTKEFFEVCHAALTPGGIFVNQAGSTAPPLAHLLSRVMKTVGSVFQNTSVISAPVPSYGSVWGLALATDRTLSLRPDPAAIDRRIAKHVEGELRMLDGETMLGLLQCPKHLRDMIAAEETVYTLDAPPVAFGQGVGLRADEEQEPQEDSADMDDGELESLKEADNLDNEDEFDRDSESSATDATAS